MKSPKYESPYSSLSFLLKLANIQKFFRTRRAIHRGEPLYLLSQEEIEAHGLLGPWSLNLYESIVAALPTVIFLWFLDIFRPETPANDALRIANKFLDLFQPFIVPITFLMLSWVASRVSFYPGDATETKRREAKYAYLYFDGSYGLWAQMSFVITGSLLQTFFDGNGYKILTDTVSIYAFQNLGMTPPSDVTAVGGIGFLLALINLVLLIWNLKIACYGVASKLFKVNGYSGEAPSSFGGKPKSGSGPWLKYQYSTILFVSLVLTGLGWVVGYITGILGLVLAGFVQ